VGPQNITNSGNKPQNYNAIVCIEIVRILQNKHFMTQSKPLGCDNNVWLLWKPVTSQKK